MNLLPSAAQSKVDIIEEPITTLYIAGNLSSHFHPLLDSMRIYFVLLRYVLSSLLAAAVDLLFFSIIIQLTYGMGLPVLLGKVIAETLLFPLGFMLQKKWVFATPKET